MRKRKGIALLTTLIILFILMGVIAATMFISIRGLRWGKASLGYTTGLSAAEGGVGIGINSAISSVLSGTPPTAVDTTVSGYALSVNTNYLGTFYAVGGGIEFASGYEGLGKAASVGGSLSLFRIVSRARRGQNNVGVEVIYLYAH